jgi:hypothetical protein
MVRPIAVDTARIFIQIPSYRDRECQWTIKDAFDKSTHPERIFFGVCWQYDLPQDQDCFLMPPPRPEQVRRIDFPTAQAKGLGWARLQAQSLWQGEEFTLQIDSHMRFEPGWDVLMLRELEACPSPWPVLTVYPPAYWPPDALETADMRRTVQAVRDFSPNGILAFTIRWVPDGAPADAPKATAALAGGFVFGPSRIIADVPSDPEIFFEGEEPNLAVRLWTHGFDLFSPTRTLLYHYYRRSESRRPWDDRDAATPSARSLHRMRQLVAPESGDVGVLGRYGLGPARALHDYELFAGVDFRTRSVAAYARHYPFVHTDEMATLLATTTDTRPAQDAELFLLGQEGFLFSPRQRAFHALTPAATFCWCGLEAGRSADEIAVDLARRSSIPLARARQQVTAQICHWLAGGVLRTAAGGEMVPAAATEPACWPMVPPLDAEPIEAEYRLLSRRLRTRCFSATDAAAVAAAVSHLPPAHFPIDGMSPEVLIEVMGLRSLRFVSLDHRAPAFMVDDPAHLHTLIHSVLVYAVTEDPTALLHIAGALPPHRPGTLHVGSVALLGDPPALLQIGRDGRVQCMPMGATVSALPTIVDRIVVVEAGQHHSVSDQRRRRTTRGDSRRGHHSFLAHRSRRR